MKTLCKCCGIEFIKRKGTQVCCSQGCRQKWKYQNDTEYRESVLSYKRENRDVDKDRARIKKWKQDNPDKVAEQKKRWAERHPELKAEIRARSSKAYKKTEAGKEVTRAYKKTEVAKAQKRRDKQVRRARERSVLADMTVKEWMATTKHFGDKCVYCGEPYEHQDHFIPLSKGGGYTKDNMVPACAVCNVDKSDTLPLEWLVMREHGLVKYVQVTQYLAGV